MKTILTIIFIFAFSIAYSQDTLKIKQIDTLVSNINNSTLPSQKDTVTLDHPALGFKTITYLTMIVNGEELIKYVNYVNATITENGVARQMTTSNSFYFDHNKLIKVEEYLIDGDEKKTVDWYYSDDKPLYYTFQSDKSEDRAAFLLTMSKTMLKQIIK